MLIEPGHLYVIPPAVYLSVAKGALHLSEPEARHGARLPFDFLLHSLAREIGPRAICVILSGTGADGSLGLKSIRESGGLTIAQDPDEAAFDGMPRSAIATGAVELVLPVERIPKALADYAKRRSVSRAVEPVALAMQAGDGLQNIIQLLRAKTAHDFTLYKPGTLQRRIERRMAMFPSPVHETKDYLEVLQNNEVELKALATDLLINVTSFFRDPDVFDALSQKIIPDMILSHTSDRPLRIWSAGCSTGEEAYSIAILFHEAIAASGRNIKLQVFASDVDSNAIAIAREGHYPDSIKSCFSGPRSARFFTKTDSGFKVSSDLRGSVVFTVQDLLADPPFSRLDMILCRNLLIYLQAEAQQKVITLFHFALREGGILVLGSAETAGSIEGRFEVISKSKRLFRHIGGRSTGEFGLSTGTGLDLRVPARLGLAPVLSRHVALAELCQRLVLENYAPAAVLINSGHECIYSLGPADRYLRMAPGFPSHDIFGMVPVELRGRLRVAIRQAGEMGARVSCAGLARSHGDGVAGYKIEITPVSSDGETFMLMCFVDEAHKEVGRGQTSDPPHSESENPRITGLERDLEAKSVELQKANRALELLGEDQKAINEEALSINEEYQSTNEELTTSKEELQSLNEELTALNGQLQETLERQRTTYNDMQNILYSTDVATIFLDVKLNIRFFTPATKLLFSIIPGDVGRPLADLSSLAADDTLLADARIVLDKFTSIQREILGQSGLWYNRHIMPYRTPDNGVEGVVITFAEMTERKLAADTLQTAKRQAELATVAKSRFLAAASHDLRQPLQALVLLQGLLAKSVKDANAQKLLVRCDETLGTMSGMLNALLDINQIEAGNVRAEIVSFPINSMLEQLKGEFTAQAQAQGLILKVVPSSLSVNSDPRLLEQMIRNLLSNALKYTSRGKVLLGCRRRKGKLSIEVWDSGIGIAQEELQAIFDEYHQIGNEARERGRGLGLGLFIVQQLAALLGHVVHVRSRPSIGSVFSIDIESIDPKVNITGARNRLVSSFTASSSAKEGAILLVEDDDELRFLLEQSLTADGYDVITAPDGVTALKHVTEGAARPALVLADYNLPLGMTGLQLAAELRRVVHPQLPVIILTGDISTSTLSAIADQQCVQLNKPISSNELSIVIGRMLETVGVVESGIAAAPSSRPVRDPTAPVVFVVDDDQQIRHAIKDVLEIHGWLVECYADSETFLQNYHPGGQSCLLVDAGLPGMNGVELLQKLNETDRRPAAIMITGNGDVPMAVMAMKAGALGFIEKPINSADLIASVSRALELSQDSSKQLACRDIAAGQVAALTSRQRAIMELVLAGHPSKNIAADLGISQRTVENHRASIMKRTGSKSLPALARLVMLAKS